MHVHMQDVDSSHNRHQLDSLGKVEQLPDTTPHLAGTSAQRLHQASEICLRVQGGEAYMSARNLRAVAVEEVVRRRRLPSVGLRLDLVRARPPHRKGLDPKTSRASRLDLSADERV